VLYPNQENRGTHVNISGGGVLKHSKQNALAEKLFDFLLSENVQGMYADGNFEFPVRAGIPVSEVVAQWGGFKEDNTPLESIGRRNTQAIKLFDIGGWK
jgi:iron(III) transport system substrate-binding protein